MTQHKKAFNNKSSARSLFVKNLCLWWMFDVGAWSMMREGGEKFLCLASSSSSSKRGITDVGKAKHENIIKIIYFSAAIVVFHFHHPPPPSSSVPHSLTRVCSRHFHFTVQPQTAAAAVENFTCLTVKKKAKRGESRASLMKFWYVKFYLTSNTLISGSRNTRAPSQNRVNGKLFVEGGEGVGKNWKF